MTEYPYPTESQPLATEEAIKVARAIDRGESLQTPEGEATVKRLVDKRKEQIALLTQQAIQLGLRVEVGNSNFVIYKGAKPIYTIQSLSEKTMIDFLDIYSLGIQQGRTAEREYIASFLKKEAEYIVYKEVGKWDGKSISEEIQKLPLQPVAEEGK